MKICSFNFSVIVCLFTLFVAGVSRPAYSSCDLSDDQAQKVEEALKAHKKVLNGLIEDMIDQPLAAADAACLDNLMGVNLDAFVVNPSSIYSTLLDQLTDQIMQMACAAVEESWNDAVSALEVSYELPYDIGGVEITSSNSDWGSQDTTTLKMPDAEAETWAKDAGLDETDTSLPDAGGLEGKFLPPVLDKDTDALTDDLKQTFIDKFF